VAYIGSANLTGAGLGMKRSIAKLAAGKAFVATGLFKFRSIIKG